MDELRKVQGVGYSTLAVSIPKSFARELRLEKGDSVLLRSEADGTLRLIPRTQAKEVSKASIRAEQAGGVEMLNRMIIGAYALGYDTVEVVASEPLGQKTIERVMETMQRLRGLEVVEADDLKIVGQSFTDPTKFPVDSLIKRLQILVSQSLENVMGALDLKQPGILNDVERTQRQIEELYWLILRQLLIALNKRDLAPEIGIESPLHASGDRVSAKALDEIGIIIRDIAGELTSLRSGGTKMDPRIAANIRKLAAKAQEAFNTTVESLLTPDIGLIGKSAALVNETTRLETEITHEMLESGEYGYARVLVSHFGQLARYCNIIIEISLNRLLRKTSKAATVQG